MTADLSLDGIAKKYHSFVALKPLTLDIPAGTFLSVLGPSGSGKTTILRLIGGFTEPSAGRIRLGGQDITQMPIFSRPCNTVFQDYALFPHLNVAQNVGYGLSVRGRPRAEIAAKVDEILAVMGLETMAARAPAKLSGGQRQRVALARALICEPRLMLLDEPLAALDAELRHQMQDFLRAQQRRTGITFLFVTHDQQEAIGISDLILVMRNGDVEQIADPRTLYYRPQTAFVAGFFGDNNLVPVRVQSLRGGNAVVETPFGTALASNPNGVSAGQSALMALRPEAISTGPALQPADNSITAEITDISFGGSSTRLILRAGGAILTKTLPSERISGALHIGQGLGLNWAASDAILLRDAT